MTHASTLRWTDASRQRGVALPRVPGHDRRGKYVNSMGRNQLIAIAPDGGMTGASDPRRNGGVAAVSRR